MDHDARGLASDLELLSAQLENLEKRVAALERGETSNTPGIATSFVPVIPENAHTEIAAQIQPVSLVSILGRAILGMAGAYLLRAAAETETFPKLAAVCAALVYAWTWQFLAARAEKSSRTAGAVYGIASALILFPMLWESTLRFQILPASVAAGVVFASVLTALVLEWRMESPAMLWVGTIFSSGAALGLLVATRNPIPFAVALLLTVALTEFAACRGRWPGLRIAAAVPVDIALCALLYLATQPGGFPAEYKSISTPALLVLFGAPVSISGGAAGYRTIRMSRQVEWADIWQTFISFALLLAAVIELAGSAETKVFGLFCFLAGVTCYLGAFFNRRIRRDSRNFAVSASWAAALFLIGSYFAIPVPALVPWFYLSAILATALARQTKQLTLGFHGFVWLIAAQISSGLMTYAGGSLVGSHPVTVQPITLLVTVSVAVCSLILLFLRFESRGIHVLRFCVVANASILLGAFLVSGIVTILPGGSPASMPRLALVRMVVICVMTLVLALSGARWKRQELVWAAYTFTGLGTLKLLLEDLRLGSTGSFALSLLVLGVLLAVIPRIVRNGGRNRELANPKS